MSRSRLMRLALGCALGALFLWLALARVEGEALGRAFAGARPAWLAAALAAFALGYALRIERWRLMLRRDNPGLRWRDCAGPFLAGFAVNNLAPFRAGDALRAFAFARRLGAGPGTVAATLFAERLLDLLALLAWLALALWALEAGPEALLGLGLPALGAAAGGLLLLFLFPGLLRPAGMALGRLAERAAPRAGGRLAAEIAMSFDTLSHLAGGAAAARLALWSLAAWGAEAGVFLAVAQALPALSAPEAAWLAMPMGTLATLIPGTPGHVGTFDYFAARAMTALGNPAAAATAFALLTHAVLWAPPVLVGGAWLALRPARLRLPPRKAP